MLMKYTTTSVLISRFPRKDDNEFKTASIKLFKVNDPHKTTELPTKTLEYANIEKIIIKKKDVEYYLEGNDLILNNVNELVIEKKGSYITIE